MKRLSRFQIVWIRSALVTSSTEGFPSPEELTWPSSWVNCGADKSNFKGCTIVRCIIYALSAGQATQAGRWQRLDAESTPMNGTSFSRLIFLVSFHSRLVKKLVASSSTNQFTALYNSRRHLQLRLPPFNLRLPIGYEAVHFLSIGRVLSKWERFSLTMTSKFNVDNSAGNIYIHRHFSVIYLNLTSDCFFTIFLRYRII